jgi:myo-inositol catabolism protein IolC
MLFYHFYPVMARPVKSAFKKEPEKPLHNVFKAGRRQRRDILREMVVAKFRAVLCKSITLGIVASGFRPSYFMPVNGKAPRVSHFTANHHARDRASQILKE